MTLLLPIIHLNIIKKSVRTPKRKKEAEEKNESELKQKKFKLCKKIFNTSNNVRPLIISAPKKGKFS